MATFSWAGFIEKCAGEFFESHRFGRPNDYNLILLTLVSTSYRRSPRAGSTCNVLGIQLWGIGLSGSMERIALDRIRRLQFIDFGYNDIGGRIPDIRWSEMSVLNRLDLKYNRFTGTIPSALGRLSNLDILALQGNRFTGTIPSSLGDAQALSILTLFDNDLRGTIPASLGNLHDLRVLCLQDNQLVGSIPSSLSELINLQELSLHGNFLSGSIPTNLFDSLTFLEQLQLHGNMLVGPIPSSIGNLQPLWLLSLYNNQLSGSIPDSVGSLSNVRYAYLFNNRLTGSIPESLGNMFSMQVLAVFNNQLTGRIPHTIGYLFYLQELSVQTNSLDSPLPETIGFLGSCSIFNFANNRLSGTLPNNLDFMTNLESFDIRSNVISGMFPSSLASPWNMNLEVIELGVNALSGSLPWELSNLQSLRNLALNDNHLGGTLPSFLGYMWSLSSLSLEYNWFSGTIPITLGFLGNLERLSLFGNRLTGAIPDSFWTLFSLTYLNLNDNDLTGTIPWSLGYLFYLQELSVQSNALTGTIPWSLGYLYNLQTISFATNDLSGTIPESLYELKSLNVFNFDDNRLSGSLTSSLSGMTSLREFRVLRNNITGAIPSAFGELQDLQSLYLYGNSLTGTIPPALGNLHDLMIMYIHDNYLTGTIPATLGNLEYLLLIGLDNNIITGTIPSSLGDMFSLLMLTIANNKLTGTIPSSLGNLQAMIVFDLSHNLLTGSVTPSLGLCSNIFSLYLHNNHLSGTIPSTFIGDNAPIMTNITLNNNHLTGTIPTTLTTYYQLWQLNLRNNHLTGTIPAELGDIVNTFRWLYLEQNLLSGTIPASLGNLNWLLSLHIGKNFLTGTIPLSLGEMSEIQHLRFDSNFLTGTVPAFLGNISTLLTLEIADNYMTGTIPDTFGVNWPQMMHLSIGGPKLPRVNIYGTIPESLCRMPEIVILFIEATSITGTIPQCLYHLTTLGNLSLNANLLHGTISEAVANLQSLYVFSVNKNSISGTLPDAIYSMEALKQISFAHSSISGTLSNDLERLKNLQYVDMSYSLLYGSLPSVISSLHDLVLFNVERNYISGSLDGVFNVSYQRKLQSIVVGGNLLTGTIPSDIFTLPQLQTFSAYGSCLENTMLPDTLCSLSNSTTTTNLRTLILDGMRSASVCRRSIFGSSRSTASSVYLPRFDASATDSNRRNIELLECLMSPAMPSLETLHMSGIGLKGRLASNISISSKLYDLSLSHNSLSGSIPLAMQKKQWFRLDLSFNYFSGELIDEFSSGNLYGNKAYGSFVDPLDSYATKSANQFLLSLRNNRLSGRIPAVFRSNLSASADERRAYDSSLVQASRMSVLDGNLFTCSFYNSDELPDHDEAKSNYDCGSNAFDAAFYAWLSAFALTFIGVCLFTCFSTVRMSEENDPNDSLYRKSIGAHISAVIDRARELRKAGKGYLVRWKRELVDLINLRSFILNLHDKQLHAQQSLAHTRPHLKEIFIRATSDKTAIVQELAQTLNGFSQVKRLVLLCIVYLLVIILPLATILTVHGGNNKSYASQYTWTVSFAYKTTWQAGVAMLVVLMVSVFVNAVVWPKLDAKFRKDASVSRILQSGKLQNKATQAGYCASTSQLYFTFEDSKHTIKWAVIIVAELAMVGGMNALLVYVTIQGTYSQLFLVQLSMVIFDLWWTSEKISMMAVYLEAKMAKQNFVDLEDKHFRYFDAAYLVEVFVKKMLLEKSQYAIQLLIVILNQVWIPVIAVAFVSSSCFYNLIVSAPMVVSYYKYSRCEMDVVWASLFLTPDQPVDCDGFIDSILSSSYQPFFSYSYHCSAITLAYLTPSIIYACIVDAFIFPVAQLCISAYLSRVENHRKISEKEKSRALSERPTMSSRVERLCRKLTSNALLEPIVYATKRTLVKPSQSVAKPSAARASLVLVGAETAKESFSLDHSEASNNSSSISPPRPVKALAIENIAGSFDDDDDIVDSMEEEEGYSVFKEVVADYSGQKYFSASQFSIELTIYLLLMLTFGMVFPPVGVVVGVTLLMEIFFVEYLLLSFVKKMWSIEPLSMDDIGSEKRLFRQKTMRILEKTHLKTVDSFYSRSEFSAVYVATQEKFLKYAGATGCLRALAVQCQGFSEYIERSKWPVLCTASLFYALFVCDAIGNEKELAGCYWALIVLAVWPPLLYFVMEHPLDWREKVQQQWDRVIRGFTISQAVFFTRKARQNKEVELRSYNGRCGEYAADVVVDLRDVE
eukprot:gene26809-32391_t